MAVEVCGHMCVSVCVVAEREKAEREREQTWPSAGLLQGALPG